MMAAVDLKVDWCSRDAAKYACSRWHYSRSMPIGKVGKIGAWEDGRFIGCVLYAWGSNQHLGKAFGLKMNQCVELCRVALDSHQTPVSRIIAISLKMLTRHNPGLRLVVSYADCDENHHGGIYIAGNWIYLGMVQLDGGTPKYRLNGKIVHGRTVHAIYGRGSQNLEWLRAHVDPNAEHVFTKGKHKYIYPLDTAMRKQITPLAQPYPKREPANEATR